MNKVVSEKTSTSLNETKKITDKLVLILKNRDYRILDTELKGFWIRVPATDISNASYIVNAKPQGSRKAIRYSIGNVSLYKAKQAREIARDWIQKIKSGIDPKEQVRRQYAQSITLEEAFEQYLSDKKLAETTVKGMRYNMRSRLSPIMKRQINSLTDELIVNWYKKNATETHKQTDKAFRELSSVLTHQVKLKNIEHNPAELVTTLGLRPKISHRTTFLTTEECGSIINEMVMFRDNKARIKQTNLFLFMLLTGLRECNVYKLKWSQIKLRESVVFEETKNGEAYILPLTALLNDILEQQYEIVPKNCTWVFPNKDLSGGTSDPRKMLNRLYKQAGVHKSFADHDLRRTFASIADLAKVSFTDAKHLMIHKKGDITEKYMQSQQIKAKDNYQRIAELLASETPVTSSIDEEGNEVVYSMTVEALRLVLFNKGPLRNHPNRNNSNFLIDVSKIYYQKMSATDWD